MKKVIFCDIDGTLLKSNGTISERTKNTIGKLKERDITFVLTTGRSRQFAINLAKQVNASEFVISSNGAEIYDYERDFEIYADGIDWKYDKKIFQLSKKLNSMLFIKAGNKNYKNYDFKSESEAEIVSLKQLKEIVKNQKLRQFNIMDSNPENIIKIINIVNKYKPIYVSHCSKSIIENNYKTKPEEEYFLDINNANINKGNGIKKFIETFNITEKDILSIGDSSNDISMFEVTGVDVAMGNAIAELKGKADHLTLTNNEDGVADFIEKYFKC